MDWTGHSRTSFQGFSKFECFTRELVWDGVLIANISIKEKTLQGFKIQALFVLKFLGTFDVWRNMEYLGTSLNRKVYESFANKISGDSSIFPLKTRDAIIIRKTREFGVSKWPPMTMRLKYDLLVNKERRCHCHRWIDRGARPSE